MFPQLGNLNLAILTILRYRDGHWNLAQALDTMGAQLQSGFASKFSLPKTNIFAPENGGPLEKEIPIGNHHFQGLC